MASLDPSSEGKKDGEHEELQKSRLLYHKRQYINIFARFRIFLFRAKNIHFDNTDDWGALLYCNEFNVCVCIHVSPLGTDTPTELSL